MVNTHSYAANQIKALSKHIHHAANAEDWDALKRLDLQVRKFLESHPEYLSSSALSQEMAQLKHVYQNAFSQLKNNIAKMEVELNDMQAQQERAKAYQMAMTMEYAW
ncbi:hypothetical protein [Enterovibrio coralii]|uniref:LafD n=1 Tax=Enterovibrio coralii TaxID=294935 RepID=A0A135I6L6_9GAMM|nr:hypothetical protein [Enterovibrio coralii]KXF81079.1 hypothetical protein ATN88_19125 [Enterovibrio coralii]